MRRNLLSGRNLWQGFGLQVFTDSELEMIHLATLEVLERTGIFVQSQEALSIFEKNGALVDRENRNVKIPAYLVDEAIRSAPQKIVLAGRDPQNDLVLESGRVNFCPFGEGIHVIDPYTGEHRKSTKKDIGDVALLVDALDQYDMLEYTVSPRDVHPKVAVYHTYEATVSNTTKHIPQSPEDKESAQVLIEMAAAVAGGKEKLRDRPIVSGAACPQSPLSLSEGCCEGIMEYARARLPMNVLSMAMAGGSSPVSLAGTLVTHNAEVLGGLVLAQLTAKGAPVIYGSSTTILDLRLASATVGCPELAMISAAVAKMAQFYQLPSYVAGG
ncbi:trimethylamine methyltransferase [Candidatus Formimonas warabiya]|uniref:Trimethylamine methyltransferase n=1 Tax=Formimonas warabiya TaxID=1761012 RepID=A0A3G1KQP2_FORW1|nr:trimethylamine methyltransferase [Candidatus Formimonas warabiya]